MIHTQVINFTSSNSSSSLFDACQFLTTENSSLSNIPSLSISLSSQTYKHTHQPVKLDHTRYSLTIFTSSVIPLVTKVMLDFTTDCERPPPAFSCHISSTKALNCNRSCVCVCVCRTLPSMSTGSLELSRTGLTLSPVRIPPTGPKLSKTESNFIFSSG